MSHSNRTSFMTAEQDSPRNSHKLPFDTKIKTYCSRKNINGTDSIEQHGQTISSFKSPFILAENQRYSLDSLQQMAPSSSDSSISAGLESSHTITNDFSHTIFNLDKSSDLNKTRETDDTIMTKVEPIPSLIIQSSTNPELKTYPIAWLLLFFIVVIRAAVAIFANTFSSIPSVTADFMGISLSSINWLYNTMAICYIVASFFTSYLYQKIGVKWSLFVSGFILSVGCWVRWIAVRINPPSFPILMAGQTIASFSSPISLNITTMFAVLWFTEDRRATAGMFIASNYGAIIAMFLMPAIATGKDKIELTVIIVASIATIASIPFIFFPVKPPTPASYAVTDASKPELTLMQGTIILLKNPQFIILCIVHSLNIGISIAWNGLMNQAISPYGYTDNQIGNIAAIGVVGGTLGCLMSGPVIDRTKQHKTLLKIMTPLMFSTYVAFIFVVKKDSFAAILYTNMLSQFFLSFMVPVCVELGVEISYPVTESLSTSILWQLSQVVGFVLVLVMDVFRDEQGFPKNNLHKGLIFQAIVAGVCLFFSIIFDGRMARTEALKMQENVDQSGPLTFSNGNPIARHHYDSADTLQTLKEVAGKTHCKSEEC